MAEYIIQVLLFQTVFLAVYDLILKKETFFQWNRAYLILTSIFAYILPLLKFQIFSQNLLQEYVVLLPEIMLSPATYIENQIDWSSILFTSLRWVFLAGITIAALFFIYKLARIFKLINKNSPTKTKNFSLVLMEDSNTAFSFFNYIFLGKSTKHKEEIIKHELIHVRQKHSIDLLYFEMQKIVFWFNPYSYIYQKRIAEIHEYIADSKTVNKKEKSAFYHSLLAETFAVDKIAFVNAFNKQSLIKKRIIMLGKNNSKEILKFRYLWLIPILIGMLIYSSCESSTSETFEDQSIQKTMNDKTIFRIDVGIVKPNGKLITYKDLSEEEKAVYDKMADTELFPNLELYRINKNEISVYLYKDFKKKQNQEKNKFSSDKTISFSTIDQVPVFPGCEDVKDQKGCLIKKITEHVSTNFDISISKSLGLEPGSKKVYVQFKIDKTGNIVDVKARAPHTDLEVEAIRVINELPQMQPGEENGKKVGVKYTLPITLVVE